jgi:hypothetical protein
MHLRFIAFLSTAILLAAFFTSTSLTRAPQAAIAATPAPQSGSLQLFGTEASAQAHCPHDVVVWLNIPSGIYHLKGERWYANTKRGAFVCKRQADAAGDRETRNGQ